MKTFELFPTRDLAAVREMADWFFELLGQTVGPITGKQLLERVRLGEVVPDTPVRKDDSQWVSAREVGGLFEAATGTHGTDIKCPYCGALIDTPPTRCASCRRQVEQAYELVLGPLLQTATVLPNKKSEDQKPSDQQEPEKRKGWLSIVRKPPD